jgi:hypothetical protein
MNGVATDLAHCLQPDDKMISARTFKFVSGIQICVAQNCEAGSLEVLWKRHFALAR